jgi:hypothetical protein
MPCRRDCQYSPRRQRIQPPGGPQALIGPPFWSGDRNGLSGDRLLASYSRGTPPLVGARRSGSIRGLGTDVDSGTRSAQQMLDEAWCSSLSRGRFTRKKHDSRFPHHALAYCLDEAASALAKSRSLSSSACSKPISPSHPGAFAPSAWRSHSG